MSRLAARQQTSLPSSPHTGRRSSSSSALDGWWEHVVPEGQLAERLRKAHEAQQAYGTTTSKATAASPVKRERRGTVTVNNSSSSGRSTVPTSHNTTPFLTSFPTRTHADADASSIRSIDSRASSNGDSVSSMRTNYDQSHKGSKVKSPSGPPQSLRAGGNGRHVKAMAGNESPPTTAQSTSSHSHRRPSSSSSSQMQRKPKAFPLLSAYGSRSPLSTTPEVSSGSEIDEPDQRDRRRTRSALTLSAMSSTATSQVQRPSSPASTSSRTSRMSFHSSLSRGSGRAASRKVNFDLDRDTYTKSEDEEHMTRSSYSLPTRNSVSPFAGGHTFEKTLHSQHASRPRVVPFPTVSASRSVEAGPSHAPSAAESLAASGAQHWFNSASSTTMSRRRTRTLSRDGFAGQHVTVTTNRPPGPAGSSGPPSRRASVQMNGSDVDRVQETSTCRNGMGSGRHSDSVHPAYPVTLDLQHLHLTRSLQSAQNSLARTTSTALGFSRSLLAVPGPLLRPLFHFTLIWCVTGATVMALVGCLMMSYFLTAWDDVGVRGKSARLAGNSSPSSRSGSESAHSGSSTSTRSPATSGVCTPGTSTTAPSSRRSSTTMELTRHALDHLVLHPLTYAAKVPIAVAKSLTPSMVESASSRRSSFATGETGSSTSAYVQAQAEQIKRHGSPDDPTSGTSTSTSTSTSNVRPTHSTLQPPASPPKPQRDLPPRPPLSSLIPTMLLTILIAVGAGLVGGWVNKYSKPTSSDSSGQGQESGTLGDQDGQAEEEEEEEEEEEDERATESSEGEEAEISTWI